jgi:hypothetical protein
VSLWWASWSKEVQVDFMLRLTAPWRGRRRETLPLPLGMVETGIRPYKADQTAPVCPKCGAAGVEYNLRGGWPVCDECGEGHVLEVTA